MHLWDFHTHQIQAHCTIYNGLLGSIPENGQISLGIHPWKVSVHWEDELRDIQTISKSDTRVIAIGEAGFDRIKGPEIALQKAAFYAQARWALSMGLPLILHCVKGHDLLLEYLKHEKDLPAIIWHGWNLKPELAFPLLEYPVFFSFGRHILEKDSNAQKWLKSCPLDRVFLETDESEVPISSIYQEASLILGLSLEQLSAQLIMNWNRISKRKIS